MRPSLRGKSVHLTSSSGEYGSQSTWESLMKNMNKTQGRWSNEKTPKVAQT